MTDTKTSVLAAAIIAEYAAGISNTSADWLKAADLWRQAGDFEKFKYCLQQAENAT